MSAGLVGPCSPPSDTREYAALNHACWLRWRAAGLVILLIASGCSATTTSDQVTQLPDAATSTAVVEVEPSPVSTPTPADLSATPTPTTPAPTNLEPSPSPTSAPTSTPTVGPIDDGTPVVIESNDGWVITQGEIDKMIGFIEDTHQLSFTAPVGVQVSADIGADLGSRFEIFSEKDWFLLRGLGLAETEADRDAANQLRRDRIRGVCCQFNGGTTVTVEIQPTKLGTEIIVVHELTHALHTQHDELFRDSRFETNESPAPFAAAIEGVPQFVTFEYFALAPPEEQLEVVPDLPIIRDDMLDLIDVGPARYLNFAYATGPAFVEAVVDARGLEGLSELISSPPTTAEQVLFPEKYLADEPAGTAPGPSLPDGGQRLSGGTIGAAMFLFLLTDEHGEDTARQSLDAWHADTYLIYETNEELCLAANIVMDDADMQAVFAAMLLDSLQPKFPQAATQITTEMISLTTCGES